jgi:uncharacterized membrane protein
MTERTMRNLVGVVLPACWLAVGILPFILAWSRLPEPMASHWSLSGTPNGALPRVALLVLHGGAALLAAIAAWVTTRREGGQPGSLAPACSMAAFVGVLFAGLAALGVSLNLDAPTWRAAGPMPITAIAAVLGISVGAAALVSRGARTLERAGAAISPHASIGLGATERASWTATARNRWLAALALALAGAAAISLAVAPAASVAICAIAAIAVLTFATISVSVSERGLRVVLGPWRFPRIDVPLASIREARAIDVSPMSRGGWGYRGSLSLFGRASVIVRGGEGIELELERGRTLVITVDDAQTAAGLLNDLVARTRPPTVHPAG